MKEEIIELSVEETQALRAKLGLAPLRLDNNNPTATNTITEDGNKPSNDKEISLSIEETNALRLKLGLSPLQLDTSNKDAPSTRKEAIHAPPPADKYTLQQAADRIQDAKDRREGIDKLNKWKREMESQEKEESAIDFAAKLRNGTVSAENGEGKRRKKKKVKAGAPMSIPDRDEDEINPSYTSSDLQGLKVGHSASAFQSGSTTILTLSDKQILSTDPESNKITGLREGEDDQNELTNVNMMDDTNALENLKRKRQVELGAGRAGGYAGFDDDEFEEFGGVVGYEGNVLGGGLAGGGKAAGNSAKGFAIGRDGKADVSQAKKHGSDLFSAFKGGAVSLESRHGNIASDFITEEEMNDAEAERVEKEKKRQMKLLEKMRRKDKKKVKKSKKKSRKTSYDEDESDGNGSDNHDFAENAAGGSGSLLESLEATAVKQEMRKKRRRDGSSMEDDGMPGNNAESTAADSQEPSDEQLMKEKRSKFERIMEKGKIRTERAFKSTAPSKEAGATAPTDTIDADEDDDAFLNAALAKARRIQLLKELSNGKSTNQIKMEARGEDAVFQAIETMKNVEATSVQSNSAVEGDDKSSGGITFENDELQEFTRALRARADQEKRAPEKSRGVKAVPGGGDASSAKKKKDALPKEEEVEVEDVDMEELANEMDQEDANDDEQGGFGSTAGSAPIGRGMSNFLSLLKQTGEIKHSGREEMRGRAKDKRTYEDYDHLNLKDVVKIDTRNAQEKDIEFANREIKLEYRDDHGRLLTRKEAYREMCYQFHGHGASKKNQERRLKQIEREREEAQLASRMEKGVGTLGALKATQKATGKAFIIHKTS